MAYYIPSQTRQLVSTCSLAKKILSNPGGGHVPTCLLAGDATVDVHPSTKGYQLQEGMERAKQPLTRGLPMDHAGVSAPIPPLQDLCLDDTDKNVGSNLLLLFKLHKIWSVDSQETR